MIQHQIQHNILSSLHLLDAWFQLKAASQLHLAELKGTGQPWHFMRKWEVDAVVGNTGQKCLRQLHRVRQT